MENNWKKFYVSKLYLSSQSPYFATLFFGEFQEAGKPEIELKDVDPQDLEKVKVISSGYQKTARRATKTGDNSSSRALITFQTYIELGHAPRSYN
ncbi:hypothetical protein B9Z55_026033 [Caenorhabditis nigoni]|uniref:BTB domain-containing protein n=1 Tax=Caenorhabditis nigoni TaxID=1611254 RepID=A0A2G5T0Y1_9PELO|nr:hypothetical protein B9Z55_026033 [Caenorhabditis nigoni]